MKRELTPVIRPKGLHGTLSDTYTDQELILMGVEPHLTAGYFKKPS